MNTSLQEKIFSLFTYIMNKIPIFICGKPGYSENFQFLIIKK